MIPSVTNRRFSVDPARRILRALVEVPASRLDPGPRFHVVDFDPARRWRALHPPLNLAPGDAADSRRGDLRICIVTQMTRLCHADGDYRSGDIDAGRGDPDAQHSPESLLEGCIPRMAFRLAGERRCPITGRSAVRLSNGARAWSVLQ